MDNLTISKLHELYLEEGDNYILNCIYYQTLKLGYDVKKRLVSKGVIFYLSNEDLESISGYVLTRALTNYDGSSAKFITYLYASIYKRVINENKKLQTYNNHNFLDYEESVKDDIYYDNHLDGVQYINEIIDNTVTRNRAKDIIKLVACGYDMPQTADILGISKQYVNQALKHEKDNKELYYCLKNN